MNRHTATGSLTLAIVIGGACVLPAAAAQLPASPHQANAIEDVTPKAAPPASVTSGLSASEHQELALRQFEAADTNQDGMLSKDEYSRYMTARAAQMYAHDLHAPERHGADARGPRDRTASDADAAPVAATDPSVAD